MKEEYTFTGQKPGEKVIEAVPSHPYVLYRPCLKTMLILLLAIGIFIFWQQFWQISAVLAIFAVFSFASAFYSFNETVLIITNMRIFLVVQKGFLKRKITEVELEKIIDMSSDTQGFTRTLLKFGDLTIRTASARDNTGAIVLQNISHPYSVQQKIASVLKQG